MKNFINTFDQDLAEQIARLPGSLRPIMQFCSLVGQPIAITAVLVLTAIVCLLVGDKVVVHASIISMLGLLISTFLKMILQRTRPDTYVPGRWRSYSFPSGHAYGVVLVSWVLGGLALNHLSGAFALTAVLLLLIFTFVTGVSRIYLGAHYPTDVVGGWVLGVIVALIIANSLTV